MASLCAAMLATGQGFLHLPVIGEYGKDFIIVNYVDWGAASQLYDHRCGSKTYDGHQGTDFVLRNFRQMDSGVMVCAAARGVVTYINDGLFDREKKSVIAKGFGNYVAIRHFNGYYSYYAHLATNSVQVQVGDTVEDLEVIARIGSSGNSSDPHLHFELWWDSIEVVDPFQGLCGNGQSLWIAEPAYDTTFGLWTSGLTSVIPNLDTLREEPLRKQIFNTSDSAIAYWALLKGLRAGDSLILNWRQPDNGLWFSFPYRMQQDAWYFYFWSYIDVPTSFQPGNWTVQLLRNGQAAGEATFQLAAPSHRETFESKFRFSIQPNPSNGLAQICADNAGGRAECLDIRNAQGKSIARYYPGNRSDLRQCFQVDTHNMLPGLYHVGVLIHGNWHWNKLAVQ